MAQAAIDTGDRPVTVSIAAERILDTRTALGLSGRFADATPRDLQVTGSVPVASGGSKTVVPADAIGVLVNVTVVTPTHEGFLSLRPKDAAGEPTTSTVNFFPGAIEPNAATVDLKDGQIQIWVETASDAGSADVLIDVVGYTVGHTHDDRYYTETEADAVHATKADSADVYTKAEVDAVHATKADSADVYAKAEVDALTTQLFATIRQNGTPVYDNAGLVSSTRTATGRYTLEFDRPVSTCAVSGTDWIWGSTRDVSAAPDSGAANEVLVQVTNEADVNEDTWFSVILHCLPLAAPTAVAADAGASAGAND